MAGLTLLWPDVPQNSTNRRNKKQMQEIHSKKTRQRSANSKKFTFISLYNPGQRAIPEQAQAAFPIGWFIAFFDTGSVQHRFHAGHCVPHENLFVKRFIFNKLKSYFVCASC